MCNYADDTTVFACDPDLDTIIRQIEEDSSMVVKRFSDNLLKLSNKKCLLILGDKNTEILITIGNSKLRKVTMKN